MVLGLLFSVLRFLVLILCRAFICVSCIMSELLFYYFCRSSFSLFGNLVHLCVFCWFIILVSVIPPVLCLLVSVSIFKCFDYFLFNFIMFTFDSPSVIKCIQCFCPGVSTLSFLSCINSFIPPTVCSSALFPFSSLTLLRLYFVLFCKFPAMKLKWFHILTPEYWCQNLPQCRITWHVLDNTQAWISQFSLCQLSGKKHSLYIKDGNISCNVSCCFVHSCFKRHSSACWLQQESVY